MAVKTDFRNYFASEKIAIDQEFDNIILVDPNKVVTSDGVVVDRLVEHENLVMYANLEARILPRTKLAGGLNFVEIANFGGTEDGKINFLKPQGKKYFDSSWTDQFTGQDTLGGGGINQSQIIDKSGSRTIRNSQDTELLGITSIKISNNSSFIPQVNIELTDVQGRTLFEQGEKSPYSAFMQLPYPLFYLTVKGYYGKAIRYELMLKSFNARFDPTDGNYKISLSFIGRTAAILSDLPMGTLFALPHMYESTVQIEDGDSTSTDATTESGEFTDYQRVTVTKGEKKIKEVFDYYKSLGLIDESLPTLTLSQLGSRLNALEQFITETFEKEDLTVLNDIDDYREILQTYRADILTFSKKSWMSEYLDPLRKFVDNNDLVYYIFKKDILNDEQKATEALAKLKSKIEGYNKTLNENMTFGESGTFQVKSLKVEKAQKISTAQAFQFEASDITRELLPEDINFEKTYILQKGVVPTPEELTAFSAQTILDLNITELRVNAETLQPVTDKKTTFFVYGQLVDTAKYQKPYFTYRFNELEDRFTKNAENIEKILSEALSQKVESPDGGLGFRPTVKNVMAYLMCSVDAFYRMMDDVHREAWNLKEDPTRLQVLPGDSDSTDSKDMIDNGSSAENRFIYPWPQYFEKEIDSEQNERYVIKYLGDPLISSKTKGYLYDVWPEVEFVEQYIKGYLQREEEPDPDSPMNQERVANFIPANPSEYPYRTRPYSDLSEISFLYELWERSYWISNYSNLFRPDQGTRDLNSVLGDFEAATITEAISSDPFLKMKLKQYGLNYSNLEPLLENISNNGTGPSWNLHIRDNFVTPYIRNKTENYYGVSPLDSWWDSPTMELAQPSQDRLKEFLKEGQSNSLALTDVYPFMDALWLRENMAAGEELVRPQEFNDTTGSIFFSDEKKTIVSFDPDNGFDTMNFTPVLPTNWLTGSTEVDVPGQTSATLETFFKTKINTNTYAITEGKINYGSDYRGQVDKIQTLSLLNTPYFINALVRGVEDKENGVSNPYAALGYLFINSLPIATLREKFLNGDYSPATFTKYAALHKVPKAWILKMGSIWHRYKRYHEDNVDILSPVWTRIDEENYYDPVNGSSLTPYDIIRQNGGPYLYEQNTAGLTNNFVSLGRVNVGIYPKVINSVTKFLYNTDLLTGYTQTDWQAAYDGNVFPFGTGLRMGTPNNSRFDMIPGQILTQPGKTISIQSWYAFYENPELYSTLNGEKVIVFPSVGGLNFSQYRLEKTIPLIGTVKGNPVDQTLYDGSIRALWGAGHYGYFDDYLMPMPKHNQYIKIIDSSVGAKQQAFNLSADAEYASIEEILSVFPKEVMDLFESEFLKFCKPMGVGDMTDPSDLMSATVGADTPAKFSESTEWLNLSTTLEKLFVVTKPEITGDEDEDGLKIAKSQLNDFKNEMNKFMNNKFIFRQGNPSGFNRRIWNSFSTDSRITPVDKIDFGTYVPNSLPVSGGTTTLLISQILNPEAWLAMYLYVGEYTADEFAYSDNGSYLTDFFYDMNIAFTQENVVRLNKIIKMYASQKLKNPQITPAAFYSLFNQYLVELNAHQADILNHLLLYLNKNLPTITEVEENKKNVLDSEVAKVELYETFKVLNDKWIAGGDFQNRTLFEDFMFLDRANRNIGDSIIVDVRSLTGRLSAKNDKNSIYSMIGFLLQENNFIFMALPAYVNFYGIPTPYPTETPLENISNTASDAFGTFLEVDTRTTRPKFLCLYTDKPSEHVSMKENIDYKFRSDQMQFSQLRENQAEKTDWGISNKVVGFNVDFGIQNQNMFQSISLDQSQYKDTSETFSILTDMANQSKGQKAAQQSTSLYNLYKSRSYTCEVTSMGNVMIQPTMYFNLRYVPMFTGPYWITDVTHTITPNNFNTTFSGVRLSKFTYPQVNDLVMSVNVDLLRKYKKPRKIEKPEPTPTVTESPTPTPAPDVIPNVNNVTMASDARCAEATAYPEKPFIQPVSQMVPWADVATYVKTKSTNNDVRRMLMGVPNCEQPNGQYFKAWNGNMIGLRTKFRWSNSVNDYIVGQLCLNSSGGYLLYGAFNNWTSSIDILNIRFGDKSSIINELKNHYGTSDDDLAKVYSTMWVGYWFVGIGFGSTTSELINKVNSDYSTTFAYGQAQFKKIINYARINGF